MSRARQQLFHTGDHPEQEPNGGVPGSARGERPPLQNYDLFQLDKYAFTHWIDQFKPPETVRNSLAEEPLTGSEFKQLVVLKDDIHPAAAEALKEIWPGVSRIFIARATAATEEYTKGLREGLSSGSEPLSIKDLQSIKFSSLPAGKLEGGKLTQEQFKAFYLPTVAMLGDTTRV